MITSKSEFIQFLQLPKDVQSAVASTAMPPLDYAKMADFGSTTYTYEAAKQEASKERSAKK